MVDAHTKRILGDGLQSHRLLGDYSCRKIINADDDGFVEPKIYQRKGKELEQQFRLVQGNFDAVQVMFKQIKEDMEVQELFLKNLLRRVIALEKNNSKPCQEVILYGNKK
jgi:hypothetical protein